MIRTFRPASRYSIAFRHVSAEPVIAPAAGEDPHYDDAILRGDLKVVGAGTLKGGVGIRYCVTKGKTYRKYPPGRDRKEWRRMHRENPQPRAE